jgi:hypothetical protein
VSGLGRRIAQFSAIAIIASALGMALPATASAAVAHKPVPPEDRADLFCRGLVEWQAAALDARDTALPLVQTAPTDRPGVKAAALALDAALKPPTKAIRQLTADLGRRPPKEKGGAAMGAKIAAAVGRLDDVYDVARERAVALKSATPPQFAKQAPRVLTRLDAGLERAGNPNKKLDTRLRHSDTGVSMLDIPHCRRVGLEWTTTGNALDTPEPSIVDAAAPGANDVTAPAVLLPGRYRPAPEIAALAARTTMTGLGRTYFYAGEPQVLTGQAFATNCPSAEASTQQILGCYRNHRIYLLAVTRAELVTVPDVTAAHEMLHAVYEGMSTELHAELDPQLSALYDATPDVHIKRLVPLYQQRTPLAVPNELHSLIGTQLGMLTPELDTYYAQFFKDRSQIVTAYVAYISVFDNLLNRFHELDVQLTDLRDQITSLRSQSQAIGAEADRLSAQINALRAQGRIAESNALVGPQNDAVRRANGLVAQSNGLVPQYNALLDEIRGVAAELGGLDSALRPL